MMSRVIVCKLGRFGELRKVVDCQMNQLSDGKSDNKDQTNQFNQTNTAMNRDLVRNSQMDLSNSMDQSSDMNQGIHLDSFEETRSPVFTINQNFEDVIFQNEIGMLLI